MAATPRSCSASSFCMWPPQAPARSAWTPCCARTARRTTATHAPDAASRTPAGLRRTPMSKRPYPLAKPMAETPRPIVAGARIGHVHLKVANLDRALAFYAGVLGFELMQRFGSQAAFISAGGYQHHRGLK